MAKTDDAQSQTPEKTAAPARVAAFRAGLSAEAGRMNKLLTDTSLAGRLERPDAGHRTAKTENRIPMGELRRSKANAERREKVVAGICEGGS